MERRHDENDQRKQNLEGLPVDTSPYTQYKDLEDYKAQAYGTHGHLQPQPSSGAAASTDAPTVAAAGPAANSHTQLSR
ncbi:UNVERIFIED_CONTAM: hypothetical protein Slati_1576000 [Sesamum latifolium]|uniref:Late embryogenesis abundant protein, LEA-18 n=1 Tax=Sesamum latifolium TaxID=2727402 RepID=A0AAW2XB22_9LAMI